MIPPRQASILICVVLFAGATIAAPRRGTLRQRIEKGRASGRDVTAAVAALKQAMQLVDIPNAAGRYSTRFVPDPAKVLEARAAVARAIQSIR